MEVFTNVNTVTILQDYTTDVIISHIISYHDQQDSHDIGEVIDDVIFGLGLRELCSKFHHYSIPNFL